MARLLLIDGGGTKIIGLLVDERMNLIGAGRSGGVNLTQTTMDDCRANVNSCLHQVFAQEKPQAIDHAYVIFVGPIEVLHEALADMGIAVNDLTRFEEKRSGLLAGSLRRQGILALAGTGSGVSGLWPDRRMGVGFLGPVFGDQGSGPWMGIQAVRAACRGMNGWGDKTALFDMMLAHWHCHDIWDAVSKVHESPSPYRMLGELTPVIGRACDMGDPVAVGIVQSAGEVMAVQTQALIQKANVSPEEQVITLCGGAWKTHSLMVASYKAKLHDLCPDAVVLMPRFEHVLAGAIEYLLDAGFAPEDVAAMLLEKLPQYAYGK